MPEEKHLKARSVRVTPTLLLQRSDTPSRKFATQSPAEKGFTLVELLVAMLVLSILAAAALPNYFQYLERSRLTQGLGTLANLAAGMEQYYLDYRKYVDDSGKCAVASPSDDNFNYTCKSISSIKC